MKKTYPLKSLMTLREQEQDGCAKAFAIASQEVRTAQTHLDLCRDNLKAHWALFQTEIDRLTQRAPAPVHSLLQKENYLSRLTYITSALETKIAGAEMALKQKLQAAQVAQAALIEAERAIKTLD